MELLERGRAQANHHSAHDNGAVNSPVEHTVLTPQGDLEVLEKEKEDKEVVHAQALLD